MIDAVHNRVENLAFSAHLSNGTKTLIRNGIYIESCQRAGQSLEKRKAKLDTYMAQFESPYYPTYRRSSLPDYITKKMTFFHDGDILEFPAKKLNWLAEFLKH